MSDLDALVAAALDRPDDDTPRLVVADWLDDHADIFPDPADARDRAAFIRLQCDRARRAVAPRPARRRRRRWPPADPSLPAGEAALLARPRDWFDLPGCHTVWNGPAPAPGCGVVTWAFDPHPAEAWPERGFVGVVFCTPWAWEGHARDILAAHPVRLVRVACLPNTPAWDGTDTDYDPATRTWEFGPWLGVRIEFPPD